MPRLLSGNTGVPCVRSLVMDESLSYLKFVFEPAGRLASIGLAHLGSNLSEHRQNTAESDRFRIAPAQREVHIAIEPVELFVDGCGLGVGLDGAQRQANRGLR